MTDFNSLGAFIDAVRAAWGRDTRELADECARQMQRLLGAPGSEAWLAPLRRELPPRAELYRDPQHGFVLLAHAEHQGLYRPPHDHGRSWVVYGVLQGAIEMGAYTAIDAAGSETQLLQQGSSIMRAGDVRAYLPGDVHDTRCQADATLLLRFTARDLKQEPGVTRYVQQAGAWVADAPL